MDRQQLETQEQIYKFAEAKTKNRNKLSNED